MYNYHALGFYQLRLCILVMPCIINSEQLMIKQGEFLQNSEHIYIYICDVLIESNSSKFGTSHNSKHNSLKNYDVCAFFLFCYGKLLIYLLLMISS